MMQTNDSQNSRKIFYEELKKLKEKRYLNEADYVKVFYAYNSYTKDLDQFLSTKEETLPNHTEMDMEKSDPHATLDHSVLKSKQNNKQNTKPIPLPQQKEKSILTPDQIRERNIAWSLILGVILLLIGGLVFGTSNWSSMSNLFKVILVSMGSIVFFASSFIAEKYLKIKKTAFAFMTLGSLFLPISIISIGFFQLFGTWFSIFGGGKYVLGFIGSILCFSLYTYIAIKYKHRLFVWFSFLTASIGVGFLLALTYLPRDFFYLGMMVYNGLLIMSFYKYKNQPKFALFTKELPIYSQLNLILSTLLMLFFFENETFYSFNLLLTALLYIAMVFVHNFKQYHYVFTILFVYGLYQLIENSFLQSFDYIGYALIGSLYLIFQQYIKNETTIAKAFRITSGIISFCAFIFISLQGLMIRYDEDSFVLLVAYLIISVNYTYLSNISKPIIFRYLAPFFLVVAGFQSYFLLFQDIQKSFLEIYVFTIATIMFVVLYLINKFHYLLVIKNSSFIVSIGTMVLMILSTIGTIKLTHAAFLFFAFGVIALVTYYHTRSQKLKTAATWVGPISWGLAAMSIYNWLEQFIVYRMNVDILGHLALSGLLLLGVSYFWKKRNQTALDFSSFIIAISVYTFSIFISFLEGYQHPYLTSCIYLVGIVIYALLVYKVNKVQLWVTVSVTSMLFLTSFIRVFKMEEYPTSMTFYLLLIPVLLLLVYEFVGRKVNSLKPYFFWTAHAFMIVAVFISIFSILFANIHPVLLFIPLGVYIYSTFKQTKEWGLKLFSYIAFTTLPVIIGLFTAYYEFQHVLTLEYIFLIVSVLIAILWLSLHEGWKKRIDWYLIPQSILGLFLFITFIDGLDIIKLVFFTLYTLFTLYLLHRRNWTIFTIIPILFATIFFVDYVSYLEKYVGIGFVLVVFFTLQLFGKYWYQPLISLQSKPIEIDWYTLISSLYIILLFVMISDIDPIWLQLLPPLLVVYYLYSLINRFSTTLEKSIVKTITAISVLLPYYTLLSQFELNHYIETELYTLPFIVLTIFLSRGTWKEYKKVMTLVQWIVLLLVTFIIVSDALSSNTVYDAIIVGILSLASIISGMHYRVKAYFFIGIGVLLLKSKGRF